MQTQTFPNSKMQTAGNITPAHPHHAAHRIGKKHKLKKSKMMWGETSEAPQKTRNEGATQHSFTFFTKKRKKSTAKHNR